MTAGTEMPLSVIADAARRGIYAPQLPAVIHQDWCDVHGYCDDVDRHDRCESTLDMHASICVLLPHFRVWEERLRPVDVICFTN